MLKSHELLDEFRTVFAGRNSFLDAIFMTVITIATVGYREVHDLDAAGKIFTTLLIIFSIVQHNEGTFPTQQTSYKAGFRCQPRIL